MSQSLLAVSAILIATLLAVNQQYTVSNGRMSLIDNELEARMVAVGEARLDSLAHEEIEDLTDEAGVTIEGGEQVRFLYDQDARYVDFDSAGAVVPAVTVTPYREVVARLRMVRPPRPVEIRIRRVYQEDI